MYHVCDCNGPQPMNRLQIFWLISWDSLWKILSKQVVQENTDRIFFVVEQLYLIIWYFLTCDNCSFLKHYCKYLGIKKKNHPTLPPKQTSKQAQNWNKQANNKNTQTKHTINKRPKTQIHFSMFCYMSFVSWFILLIICFNWSEQITEAFVNSKIVELKFPEVLITVVAAVCHG